MPRSANQRRGAGFDPRVVIEVLPISALTPIHWNQLWKLTQEFFETERSYAESKLKEYQSIALFWTRTDRTLIGAASINVFPVHFQNRRLVVIYTTHVMLREEYRGHNLIQRLGLRTFLKTWLRFPFRSVYWFFDTSSYKSYLLLPRNFREFWPRREQKTPDHEHGLINQLATTVHGASWRPQLGIVTRSKQMRLRPEVAPLNRNVPLTPELRFFSSANPGHEEGDLLVFLCPLTPSNWFSVGVNALRRMRKRRNLPPPTDFS